MRLWHQSLLPYLDRQRLLSQHRECAALRGKGWGKKHATVDYVFTHHFTKLVAYHWKVMDEMKRRGYNPDEAWLDVSYRGKALGHDIHWKDTTGAMSEWGVSIRDNTPIYPEHNDAYLAECLRLLREKEASVDWDAINAAFAEKGEW